MNSLNERDYRLEIKKLEDETTRDSEQALASQEERSIAAVHEITHSITSMSQENDLVEVKLQEESGEDLDKYIIDPSELPEKIGELDKFVELLKLTHLEQETLDFFLRYTISSAELLRLKSTQDSNYVELEGKVKELEREITETHQREIEDTKLVISDGTEELAKDQDRVNELFLETTDVLEECEQLMKELDQAREEKKASREQVKNKELPLEKLYQEGDAVRQSYNTLKILDERVQQLETLKRDLETNQGHEKSSIDPSLSEIGCALNSLINLWETNFMPGSKWHNLEVYPQSRRFQFDVSENYTVVIVLDEISKIGDILVYIKDDSGFRIDEKMQLDLKEQNVGNADIYKSMENIIDRLKS